LCIGSRRKNLSRAVKKVLFPSDEGRDTLRAQDMNNELIATAV
jgi:hypothetical protein